MTVHLDFFMLIKYHSAVLDFQIAHSMSTAWAFHAFAANDRFKLMADMVSVLLVKRMVLFTDNTLIHSASCSSIEPHRVTFGAHNFVKQTNVILVGQVIIFRICYAVFAVSSVSLLAMLFSWVLVSITTISFLDIICFITRWVWSWTRTRFSLIPGLLSSLTISLFLLSLFSIQIGV